MSSPSWFKRNGSAVYGNTLEYPVVKEQFAPSSGWADWEFLETPREISIG